MNIPSMAIVLGGFVAGLFTMFVIKLYQYVFDKL